MLFCWSNLFFTVVVFAHDIRSWQADRRTAGRLCHDIRRNISLRGIVAENWTKLGFYKIQCLNIVVTESQTRLRNAYYANTMCWVWYRQCHWAIEKRTCDCVFFGNHKQYWDRLCRWTFDVERQLFIDFAHWWELTDYYIARHCHHWNCWYHFRVMFSSL